MWGQAAATWFRQRTGPPAPFAPWKLLWWSSGETDGSHLQQPEGTFLPWPPTHLRQALENFQEKLAVDLSQNIFADVECVDIQKDTHSIIHHFHKCKITNYVVINVQKQLGVYHRCAYLEKQCEVCWTLLRNLIVTKCSLEWEALNITLLLCLKQKAQMMKMCDFCYFCQMLKLKSNVLWDDAIDENEIWFKDYSCASWRHYHK